MQKTLLQTAAMLAVCPLLATLAAEPLVRTEAGFRVERVYVVDQEGGSWISLCADVQGVLYAGDQYGSVYRLEVMASDGPSRRDKAEWPASSVLGVQRMELPIGGVHGMTWIGSSLYAVVGERDVCQPGLYRLDDKNGDSQLDTVELLAKLDGAGEHGPHAVVAAPGDDRLYLLAGNATTLPPLTKSRVPRLWANDALAPFSAVMGSELRGKPHGGWICRVSRNGREWELVCMGLRNAYTLAVDSNGELFTCDSDTEFEIGTPWYRSNRVLHCVSGADFGWRQGALKTPEHSPDTLPAVLPIGAGSPTAAVFPTGAAFPERYQKALLVGDWSFGRLLAVHLRPEGAGFTATSEEIVTGTPLAITAVCVNPRDKAVYFVTGGRKTQSALYRLTWNK